MTDLFPKNKDLLSALAFLICYGSTRRIRLHQCDPQETTEECGGREFLMDGSSQELTTRRSFEEQKKNANNIKNKTALNHRVSCYVASLWMRLKCSNLVTKSNWAMTGRA
ncbi:hypothetical protein F444_22329 [Phytophthora nicotianae P1976]|uniref:Uncharacterized protein n=1 Tax=Phytophthora nicotianae P1976 TaxID=1317066 RepID=A0A080YY39_PHYNI|nr:hypothetical protein F444_22329 [Phytophthora nicotianae P1976]